MKNFFFCEINSNFSLLFLINKVSSFSKSRRIMFRESYANKYVPLRGLLLPIEFNGMVVSLGCWMVKGGTVLPTTASISPGAPKIQKAPTASTAQTSHPGFLQPLLSQEQGEKAPTWQKGNSLLGDVYTLPLRMAALAVQFVQSHTAFKTQKLFFPPGVFSTCYRRYLSYYLFLLPFFLRSSVHNGAGTGMYR